MRALFAQVEVDDSLDEFGNKDSNTTRHIHFYDEQLSSLKEPNWS
jgi:hypothetical protein